MLAGLIGCNSTCLKISFNHIILTIAHSQILHIHRFPSPSALTNPTPQTTLFFYPFSITSYHSHPTSPYSLTPPSPPSPHHHLLHALAAAHSPILHHPPGQFQK